jgi:hypothetical protein
MLCCSLMMCRALVMCRELMMCRALMLRSSLMLQTALMLRTDRCREKPSVYADPMVWLVRWLPPLSDLNSIDFAFIYWYCKSKAERWLICIGYLSVLTHQAPGAQCIPDMIMGTSKCPFRSLERGAGKLPKCLSWHGITWSWYISRCPYKIPSYGTRQVANAP